MINNEKVQVEVREVYAKDIRAVRTVDISANYAEEPQTLDLEEIHYILTDPELSDNLVDSVSTIMNDPTDRRHVAVMDMVMELPVAELRERLNEFEESK